MISSRPKIFVTIAAAILATAAALSAPPDNLDKLKRQKQDTRREITRTQKKIKDNTRETSRQMSRLETLRGDIARQKVIIGDARRRADSVKVAMAAVNDSIADIEKNLSGLQRNYAAALRGMQGSIAPADRWAFILSAGSVKQLWRRMRYVRQYTLWSERKAGEIRRVKSQLTERKARLGVLSSEHSDLLARADLAGRQLTAREAETEKLVAQLKKEKGTLQAYLKEKEAQKRNLDTQIDQMITRQVEERRRKEQAKAEEKRRHEKERRQKEADKSQTKTAPDREKRPDNETHTADPDRRLTGSFESNRGRLLFPVSGKYRISRGFGHQPHPELPHVMTDNSGIDIEVSKSTQARAVYEGTVSAIFRQDGFNNIVMVRHGAYITIYARLGSLSVKSGDKVKTGQLLGTIFTDPSTGLTTLHFEIRREREKLNPTQWVR